MFNPKQSLLEQVLSNAEITNKGESLLQFEQTFLEEIVANFAAIRAIADGNIEHSKILFFAQNFNQLNDTAPSERHLLLHECYKALVDFMKEQNTLAAWLVKIISPILDKYKAGLEKVPGLEDTYNITYAAFKAQHDKQTQTLKKEPHLERECELKLHAYSKIQRVQGEQKPFNKKSKSYWEAIESAVDRNNFDKIQTLFNSNASLKNDKEVLAAKNTNGQNALDYIFEKASINPNVVQSLFEISLILWYLGLRVDSMQSKNIEKATSSNMLDGYLYRMLLDFDNFKINSEIPDILSRYQQVVNQRTQEPFGQYGSGLVTAAAWSIAWRHKDVMEEIFTQLFLLDKKGICSILNVDCAGGMALPALIAIAKTADNRKIFCVSTGDTKDKLTHELFFNSYSMKTASFIYSSLMNLKLTDKSKKYRAIICIQPAFANIDYVTEIFSRKIPELLSDSGILYVSFSNLDEKQQFFNIIKTVQFYEKMGLCYVSKWQNKVEDSKLLTVVLTQNQQLLTLCNLKKELNDKANIANLTITNPQNEPADAETKSSSSSVAPLWLISNQSKIIGTPTTEEDQKDKEANDGRYKFN